MTPHLLQMTAEIVSSYVSSNQVEADQVPDLIRSVFGSLNTLGQPAIATAQPPSPTTKPTAAAIRKSITPEALTSFIDGRPYIMLKRHLTTNNMTFAEYKKAYGLPDDYPATAPAYSARRSEMAKGIGLGQRRHQTAPEAPEATEAVPVAKPRGRPKKV